MSKKKKILKLKTYHFNYLLQLSSLIISINSSFIILVKSIWKIFEIFEKGNWSLRTEMKFIFLKQEMISLRREIIIIFPNRKWKNCSNKFIPRSPTFSSGGKNDRVGILMLKPRAISCSCLVQLPIYITVLPVLSAHFHTHEK